MDMNDRFRIGVLVCNGIHIATLTDVYMARVALTTLTGTARMFCPRRLVQIRTALSKRGAVARSQ
ncbi:hypothetical protein A5630_21215 [Mycolicibacterium mucogenicum]|uniref:Uncharacterized protein n=1 Tax=Mycolicibacterium mucogenicum TaxID=56689 RepID=A0A1A3H3N6_MYCMU|nr:hypothetical protein A5630_21215 [Mycolicibacterium mucogenicum]